MYCSLTWVIVTHACWPYLSIIPDGHSQQSRTDLKLPRSVSCPVRSNGSDPRQDISWTNCPVVRCLRVEPKFQTTWQGFFDSNHYCHGKHSARRLSGSGFGSAVFFRSDVLVPVWELWQTWRSMSDWLSLASILWLLTFGPEKPIIYSYFASRCSASCPMCPQYIRACCVE